MKKYAPVGMVKLLVALLLTAGALGPAGCGGGDTDTPGSTTGSTTQATGGSTTSTSALPEKQVFTVEDLARFDGKDGRPAYVAVDGLVYDLTGSRSWPDGEHGRCGLGAAAGKDLSAEIQKAPTNMRSLLENMPVVGRLAE